MPVQVKSGSIPQVARLLALFLLVLAIGACTPEGSPTNPPPSLEIRPTSTGRPAPTATPEARLTSPVQPPAPSPEVRPTATPLPFDVRAILPAAPAGYGTAAGHLVFFSNRSGTHELYRIALDGSGLTQLSNAAPYGISAYDMEPAWSADGKIAFASDHANGSWEVFALLPGEAEPRQLTELGADCWSLAWSPDGTSLLFVSRAAGWDEIYRVAPDGSAPVNLTQQPDAGDYLPAWSPAGDQIAFVSDREGLEDIFVMAPDGSGVSRLTEAEGRDTSPNWSPDGTRIAFVSEREGNFEVYVMNADGSGLARLTDNRSYEWSPTWSPDGNRIAFTSTRDDLETYNVYVMAPDGSGQTRLTSDPANDIIPKWWP